MSQPARLALSTLVSVAAVAATLLAAIAGATRATGGVGAPALPPPAAVTAASSSSLLPVDEPDESGPLPGVFASEIHWTRWSTLVVHGGAAVLEGQVVVDDRAIGEAVVDLFARPAGSSAWAHAATAVSNPDDGVFRFTGQAPGWTTDYRVVYEGNLAYARSEGTRHVPVARRISSGLKSNPDGMFTFSGSVTPTYAGRTVRLQRKASSAASWSTVSSTRTSRDSRWTFRVRGPSSTGTYYYRVFTPSDARYVTSYSDTRGLRRA